MRRRCLTHVVELAAGSAPVVELQPVPARQADLGVQDLGVVRRDERGWGRLGNGRGRNGYICRSGLLVPATARDGQHYGQQESGEERPRRKGSSSHSRLDAVARGIHYRFREYAGQSGAPATPTLLLTTQDV